MNHDARLRTLVSEGGGASETISEERATLHEAPETIAPPPTQREYFSVDQLQVGEVIGGRFQVQLLAQLGGMGAIYRAHDLLSSGPVAVKTLRPGTGGIERFEREAARLAALHHSGIPAFVASGVTPGGQAYFAMEWLDGIDLATYLRQRRLSLRTAVSLVQTAAEAVACAHQAGIVHRDLSPSNLFLVHGNTEDVRVLDFGVSRLTTEPVTDEGVRVGTPGYMAPEQIEGRDVTPATDVFALGSILYELLTGQRTFFAPTVNEVLARVLRDTPHAPSELNGAIPPELDEVVLACLDKNPHRRPEHAHELAQLLSSLQGLLETTVNAGPPLNARGSAEPHVASVLLLRDFPRGTFDRVSQVVSPHGLRPLRGPDDSILLAAAGPGTAADHAGRAARAALAIRKATRTPHIALVTGLAQLDGPVPTGRTIEAARASLSLDEPDEANPAPRGPMIWLDESTASLLDSRFDVRQLERGPALFGMQDGYEPIRIVLGKKTRLVGRRRELGVLEASLSECLEERVAGAVLVTGAPGIGKSRLAYEFTRQARRLGRPLEILRGSLDSTASETPFSILAQTLQRACHIREAEPDSVRRAKLLERLERSVPTSELRRVSEFLGELIGTDVTDAASPELLAAQHNSSVRGEQILRAFEDWLRAECALSPVLLILDDLHWCDLPTVRFVDSVVRNLAELPLLVIALARPEVHEFFPKLWSQRGVTELRLSGLSPDAALSMIHQIEGPDVDGTVASRVLHRAQGNPFWIEELLRAEAAGHGEDTPDHVLVLAQSRIEQLHPDARRFVRAGSVFGQRFWLGGARSLLGSDSFTRPVEIVVRDLLDVELLSERDVGELQGDREFEFTSGLLRDAAYSFLPEEEREQAHAEAAQWLERHRETEALPIAMHYTLGGEPDRARAHYVRAAEQALQSDDLDGALLSVQEGLAAGVSGDQAVALRLIEAEAHGWRGDNSSALRAARRALNESAPGRRDFFRALAECAIAATTLGDIPCLLQCTRRVEETAAEPSAALEKSIALCRIATQLLYVGRLADGERLLERAEELRDKAPPNPRSLGFLYQTRAARATMTGRAFERIEHADRAVEYFEDAGARRHTCQERVSLVLAEIEAGSIEGAVFALEEALGVAERLALASTIALAKTHLGRALGRVGRLEEAQSVLDEASALADRQRNLRLSGLIRLYLTEIHAALGQAEAALDEAARAIHVLGPFPAWKRLAHATRLLALLEFGRTAEARGERKAIEELRESTSSILLGETLVRLSLAEIQFVEGDILGARRELTAEALRLEAEAEGVSPEQRERFLSATTVRRRLFALLAAGGPRESFVESLSGPSPSFRRPSLGEEITLEDVERLLVEGHPERTQLGIALGYHDLGRELGRVLDRTQVSWPSIAAWAAAGGAHAQQESAWKAVCSVTVLSEKVAPDETLGGRLLAWLPLARPLERAIFGAARELSLELVELRKRLFNLLASELAKLARLLEEDANDAEFAAFLRGVEAPRSGDEGKGGQLRTRAFQAFFEAGRTVDDTRRAELVLLGNVYLGAHEQAALQEFAQPPSNGKLPRTLIRRLKRELPRGLRWLARPLLALGFRRLVARFEASWRRLAPRLAVNFSLPRAEHLPLTDEAEEAPKPALHAGARALHVAVPEKELEELWLQLDELEAPPAHAEDATEDRAALRSPLQSRVLLLLERYRSVQSQREWLDTPVPAPRVRLLKASR